MFAGSVPRRAVGGENAEHLQMAVCLIFKRPMEVISKPPAENTENQGKAPFSHVHGHFRGHAGRAGKGDYRERSELSSDETPCLGSHSVEPHSSLPIIHRIDHPQQDLADGFIPRGRVPTRGFIRHCVIVSRTNKRLACVMMQSPVGQPPSLRRLAPLVVIQPRSRQTRRRLCDILVRNEHHSSCTG